MTRTPFDRWDVGEPPLLGARHPLLGEYFDGTTFAIRYDRRWELIATWPYLTRGTPEHTCALVGALNGKSARSQQAARAYAVRQAQKRLVDFVRHPSALEGTHLLRCEMPEEPCPHEGLFSTLDGMLTEAYDFSQLRALWLIEGFFRWNRHFPENIEEIESSEKIQFPRHYRSQLAEAVCNLTAQMDKEIYISKCAVKLQNWESHLTVRSLLGNR